MPTIERPLTQGPRSALRARSVFGIEAQGLVTGPLHAHATQRLRRCRNGGITAAAVMAHRHWQRAASNDARADAATCERSRWVVAVFQRPGAPKDSRLRKKRMPNAGGGNSHASAERHQAQGCCACSARASKMHPRFAQWRSANADLGTEVPMGKQEQRLAPTAPSFQTRGMFLKLRLYPAPFSAHSLQGLTSFLFLQMLLLLP